MKKLITRIAAVLLAAALLCCLAACDEDGNIADYLQENGIDTSNLTPEQLEQIGAILISGSDSTADEIDTTVAGDTLPEAFICSWEVEGLYQHAVASDITSDEALERERAYGVSFGYNYFSRFGEEITGAVFKVNESAAYDDMSAMGIQTSPLVEKFGADAKITSVVVNTADGSQCTTVFLINDTTLVAFGAGMNVFTYTAMEAMG